MAASLKQFPNQKVNKSGGQRKIPTSDVLAVCVGVNGAGSIIIFSKELQGQWP